MTLLLAGQVTGLALACGLNLYLTVATLGIVYRLGLLASLPPGLQGLAGPLVIGSAVALYFVETVVDKIPHADSMWDAAHTFIRPPAAALLTVAALWELPAGTTVAGATVAFAVALTAHGTKAGLRMTMNATGETRWHVWISVLEDVAAAALAIAALRFPLPTLAVVGGTLLVILLLGKPLWGAFVLGNRAIIAWGRSIVLPARWRNVDELPPSVRALLEDTPLGTSPPRGTSAALRGLPHPRSFRNGWLVLNVHGPLFVARGLAGARRFQLPAPRRVRHEPGIWADILRVETDEGPEYSLFLLKDGPDVDLALQHLNPVSV